MDIWQVVITTLASLAAAVLGAVAASWLKKSRPWVGLMSIDRDDSVLVPVSPELRRLAEQCHWTRKINEPEVPLHCLIDLQHSVRASIDLAKSTLEPVTEFENKLKGGITLKEHKARELSTFLCNGVIGQVLQSMNQRGVLPLPESIETDKSATPVFKGEDLTTHDVTEKAFLLYVEDHTFLLRPGSGIVGQEALRRTSVLGKILQYFLESHLQSIVAAIREELQTDLQALLEIQDRLKDTIQSRRLVVRAQITNLGGSPEHIEPYGILRIRSGGKPIDPIIVAVQNFTVYEPGMEDLPRMFQIMEGLAKKMDVQSARTPAELRQAPEYVIVKPGDLVVAALVTIDPIEDQSVITALEMGMLSCSLVLKRANKTFLKWISSNELTMGLTLNPERRQELEAKGRS